jgi:hypothetical protein
MVAGLLRLGSILVIRSFLHPVTWEFGQLARSIVAGFGFTDLLQNGTRVPGLFISPAYPYFLAFFFWLTGDGPITYLIIEVLQAAFGVLLVYLVYRIASILLGKTSAIVAACLTAVYPAQIYICNEFHGVSIYIVLGTGAVFFLVRYVEVSKSWMDVIASGLCMGLLMYFRAEATALVLVYAAILWFRGGWRVIGQVLAFILIAFACLSPWTIRNYLEVGKFVPVCASAGMNLWIGNNASATGSEHYDFMSAIPFDLVQAAEQIPLDRQFEVAVDNAYKRSAIEFIRTHPQAEVKLALRKLFIFFVFDPSHEKGRNPAYWLPSLLLTLLAIWGAARRGKRLLREDLFIVASILFAVAVSVVVFVLPRYKIVIDPFLMILASAVFAQRGSQAGRLVQPGIDDSESAADHQGTAALYDTQQGAQTLVSL